MSKLRVGLCPTLTSDILDKLQQHEIYTVGDLVIIQDVEELAKNIRVSCKHLVALRHVLSAQFAALPVCAADLYDDTTRNVSILSAGCKSLDEYLDGGIYTMEITELVGEIASGKTLFCQNITIELASTAKQSTIWVDTCGSFDAMKYQRILEERGLNDSEVEDICSRIQIIPAFDVWELLSVLDQVTKILDDENTEPHNIRLVVIDSVTVLLSSLLSGYTVEGHAILVQVSRTLKALISDYPVAVLMTNSLVGTADPSTKKPALGRAWASVPNNRLMLQRKFGQKLSQTGTFLGEVPIRRFATLLKSSRQLCGKDIAFDIGDRGLQDFDQNAC